MHVEKSKLVGAVGVISGSQLNWVTGIAKVQKIYALDYPAVSDVKARNNAYRK
jgi:hypothetical protein